jgi:hypothetical protein
VTVIATRRHAAVDALLMPGEEALLLTALVIYYRTYGQELFERTSRSNYMLFEARGRRPMRHGKGYLALGLI